MASAHIEEVPKVETASKQDMNGEALIMSGAKPEGGKWCWISQKPAHLEREKKNMGNHHSTQSSWNLEQKLKSRSENSNDQTLE